MIKGRWSELKMVIELKGESTVNCAETIAKSLEELGLVRGVLVGSTSLRRASSLLLIRIALIIQGEVACLSAIWEN